MMKDPKHLLLILLTTGLLAGGCSLIDGVPSIGADDNNEENNTTANNNGNGPSQTPFIGHWEITDGDEGGIVIFNEDGTGLGNGEFFLEELRDKSGCEDVASWAFAWVVEFDEEGSDVLLLRMTITPDDVDFLGSELECDARGYEVVETVELTRGDTDGATLKINTGPTLERFANNAMSPQLAFEDNLNFIKRGTPIQLLNIGHSAETDAEQILSVEPKQDGMTSKVLLVEDNGTLTDDVIWEMTPLGNSGIRTYSLLQSLDQSHGSPNSAVGSNQGFVSTLSNASNAGSPVQSWALRYEGRCIDLELDCPDTFGGPSGLVFKLTTIGAFADKGGSQFLNYAPGENTLSMKAESTVSGRDLPYQLWLMRPVDP